LVRLIPTSLPLGDATGVDFRVLVFAGLLTALTGLGFGAIPALRIGRSTEAQGLREGSHGGLGGRRERLRRALVIVEVAVSVVLLISAGLLIRALWRIQAVDSGFRTEGVLTLRTPLPLPRYEGTARRVELYSRVLSEVRALPNVSSAAYISSFLPMVMRGGIWQVEIDEGPDDYPSRTASLSFVTPDFFRALGIPLRLGRDLSEADTLDRQVPDGALVGYIPKDLVLHSSSDPGPLLASLRGIVKRADPELPVSDVRLLSDIVDAETVPRRTQIRILALFAGISLLLAGVGIHGLLSFAVSQRIPEIGLRMALGARPGDILALVLRQGLLLAATGGALGLLIAYAAGRSMEALLAGVEPGDGLTFLTAGTLALLMTFSGSLSPALRAVRVDPTRAIRTE
jgi:putative ABC transport system permease protein